MKKLLFLRTLSICSLRQALCIAMVYVASSAYAQTIPPPFINYQAVLYDVNGTNPNNPLINQSFSTFVNINDELGNLLYREEHYASTDANGLITVKMGDGLYTAGPITNFNQINWGVGKYYLVVDFDINGTISSTAPEQLVTVPYSFYAGNAGNGMTAVADNGNGTLTFTYANGQTYITPALTGITGAQGPIGLTGPSGPIGAQGVQGVAGPSGASGPAGAQGPIGLAGATGPQGIQGPAGNDGAIGVQGPIGLSGSTGVQGPIGLTGATGPQGIQGLTGNDGAIGAQGPIGLTGSTGVQGPIGLTGATGPQGIQGSVGNDGVTGPQGPIGLTGATGPQGIQGLTGNDGANGATGLTGPSGAQGIQGLPGTNGTDGAEGATGAQGPIGLAGATGPQGIQGPVGNDGAIGAQGPIGLTGSTGAQGPTGLTGATGPQGPTGLTGAIGPSASSPSYTIGLWPELGGYVFWVSLDGKHGLVAETQDQGTTTWFEAQNLVSNTSVHSINGQKYRDWRMPTKNELSEMYLQRSAIGGFSNFSYWNSTEMGNDIGYRRDFSDGNQYFNNKSGSFNIRAVRTF